MNFVLDPGMILNLGILFYFPTSLLFRSLHLETGHVVAIKRIQLLDQKLKEVDDLMVNFDLTPSNSQFSPKE